MSIDLLEEKTLLKRPRLKETCIKLYDLAQQLGADAKLPTTSELRTRFNVSTYTLNDAIRELERRQVLRSVNGVGVFVASGKKVLSGNIGIVGSSSFGDNLTEYYNLVLKGIESQTQKHQQHSLFLGTENTCEIQSLEKIDGLLVIGADVIADFASKIPANLPVVSVLTATRNISSVIADDYQGAALAIEYLHQKGHRRIACLLEENPTLSKIRYQSYCETMDNLKISWQPEWVRKVDNNYPKQNETPTFYLDWARQQMQSWLQEGFLETGCTAIFVQNEVAAIGVMQVLQQNNIKVPTDISVIGFDGTRLCDLASPKLCAVEVPLAEMGMKAMQLLNGQIYENQFEIKNSVLPLRIREGESVRIIQ